MGILDKQISKATNSDLAKPDNHLIGKIIQYLEEHPEESENATNTIKERLKTSDVKVRMFTLFLLDK